MAHRMVPDGIPENHAPLGLYSDDTSASHWKNEKIIGIYGVLLAYDPENRTSSVVIRCFGAATNKVQSDTVIEFCVDDFTKLAEVGIVVHTFLSTKSECFISCITFVTFHRAQRTLASWALPRMLTAQFVVVARTKRPKRRTQI